MNIYKISLVIISLLLLSCSDSFLERDPKGTLDEETYLKTDDAAFKLVTSCYDPMHSLWSYAYADNRVGIGSLTVDDGDVGGSDAGNRPHTSELASGRPLTNNFLLAQAWTHRYQAIGRCNIALENLTNEENVFIKGGEPLSKKTLSRYISEVKFLRSWYYFDLVNTFKEIPLITDSQLPSERFNKATSEELRKQLYKDLDEAIADPNLPWKSNMDIASELGRVTKDAAYTFKARIALFYAGLMEQNKIDGDASSEYKIAKDAAHKVITEGNLSLTKDFQDLYGGDYDKGLSTTECIFTALSKYIPSIGYVTDNFAIMNVGRNNVGGYGGCIPTVDLANSFNPKDPRKLFTIIKHGDIFKKGDEEEVHNYEGYYNFSLQHSRKAFVPYDYRDGGHLMRSKWAPYWIRYAEALLIYAEATLKTGGSYDEVAKYINMVRHRAFVTTSKKDSFAIKRKFDEALVDIDEATFLSDYAINATDDLEQAIKNERRAEFAMEGLRLYDLIRWGDYVKVMQNFHQTYQYGGKGREASDKSWPFPIPQAEIDKSNGVLEQNPNYK